MIIEKRIVLALKHYLNYYLPSGNSKEIKKKYDSLFKDSKKKVKAIEIENLTKVYHNGIKALDDLSLKIHPKEFIVLLGPSGCGKTTLLRMIAGLESISDGYVKFDDVIINGISSKDRELAMVFQNYALYPFMSVFKNIAFGLNNKAYKNSVYKEAKEELKKLNNPLLEKILEVKAKIKILSRIDDNLKDDILRNERVLKTTNQKSDQKRYNKLKVESKKLNDIVKNFKKDTNRKNQIKKLKEEFKVLKEENIAKRKEDKEKISKEATILIEKMYESAKVWKDSIPNMVEKVTKMLGIDMFVNRKPADLSGGQRQRVALARAISKETGLYLYDEPLSNLDAKLRANMRKEIRKIHNMMNATSIYVTHDQIEAMSMADRIVVMHKGYIQQIGTPRELMEKPLNLFVAQFIGNTGMNTFNASYLEKNIFKVNNKTKIEILKSYVTKKLTTNKNPKIIGIRPEHVITDKQLVSNLNINKFKGKIAEMEMLGNDVLVEVTNDKFPNIQMIVPLARGAKIGEDIEFVLNPNKTYVYDAKTGYNLLVEFDKDNLRAKNVWTNGKEERRKNIYILNKEKNRLSLSQYIRNLIIYPISKRAQETFKKRKAKIDYGDQDLA